MAARASHRPGRAAYLVAPWSSGRRGRCWTLLEGVSRPVMNEETHWSMVRGLTKPGDFLARSDLCHLHDGRAAAESCALDEKLQGQDRDVVLVARSGSNQHVWVVRRSLSEIINGRLLPRV